MIDRSAQIETLRSEVSDIKSEMLLNYLFPEMEERWCVNNLGVFYRNYSGDLISFDSKSNDIDLSRDGFLKLLPTGLISREDIYKSEDRGEALAQERERQILLQEFFRPFDSIHFRRYLKMERYVSDLHNSKIAIVLRNIFGVEIESIESPYAQRFAVLLPLINRYKGDMNRLQDLISVVAGCEVRKCVGRYSEGDRKEMSLPEVHYNIIMDELSSEEYIEAQREMRSLEDFLREWFVPFDIVVRLKVISSRDEMTILGYNTRY